MRYDRSVAIAKRHEALLLLIRTGSYSSSELAQRLTVSEPTIYRDILFLKRQGYRIEAVRLPARWAYQLPDDRFEHQSSGPAQP